ncbi:MarR family winged helix-turn-helix transcriptional regulator [Micromonospora sp. SH-82]|uniref:MarR family winged helix-turn-helix transcriptional regulator n=1 Tax=Micromonospora sp. SH-82 TaxID=3132938 RepID=UPI003EBDBC45
MVVERNDGINLRRLAAETDMLLSSASRLCDRLEAAGMVEREPGRADRREISLHLTPQGRRILAELRSDRRRRLADVLARMTPAGQEALLSGLTEFDEASREHSGAGPGGGAPPPSSEPAEPSRPRSLPISSVPEARSGPPADPVARSA